VSKIWLTLNSSWPVTLASQDLCHYPFPIDITAAPNNTLIPTAVAYGRTFISNENCYLSYPSVIAAFPAGFSTYISGTTTLTWSATTETIEGKTYTLAAGTVTEYENMMVDDLYSYTTLPGGVLTVPSTELQSYRGMAGYFGSVYSFNFADLPPNPVPVLAYEGSQLCFLDLVNSFDLVFYPDTMEPWPWCTTIVDDAYEPFLVYPTQFLDLDPAFASCVFDLNGIFDPPTALATAGFLTPPTVSGPASTTPADPGPTLPLITAVLTTIPFLQLPESSNSSPGGSGDPAGNSASGSGSDPGGDPGGPGSNRNQGLESISFSTEIASWLSGTGSNGNSNDVSGSGGGVPAPEDTNPDDSSVIGAILTLGHGSTTITASEDGNWGIVVAGQTIQLGDPPATIGEDLISAAPGGSIVVVSPDDLTTIALSQIAGSGFAAQAQVTLPPAAILTLGGEVVTAIQGDNGGVLIDGTTLPQRQTATIGGQTLYVAPGGNAVVVAQNGQTTTVPLINPNPIIAVFTLDDGEVVTATSMTAANGKPVIAFGNTTLTVDGTALTTDGVVLSAVSAGLVVAGPPRSGSDVTGAIFTIGSSVFTAVESVNAQGSTIVVIGGQTLTLGGAQVTLPDGEIVSAGTSGLLVIGNGKSSSVPYSAIPATMTTTSTLDLASLTVMSPSGGVGTAGSGATSTSKKGGSGRMEANLASVFLASLMVMLGLYSSTDILKFAYRS